MLSVTFKCLDSIRIFCYIGLMPYALRVLLGLAVPTVRFKSESLVSLGSGTLIRINPNEPQVPFGHIGLKMTALAALKEIHALLGQQ